jgi:hypothetical protein
LPRDLDDHFDLSRTGVVGENLDTKWRWKQAE